MLLWLQYHDISTFYTAFSSKYTLQTSINLNIYRLIHDLQNARPGVSVEKAYRGPTTDACERQNK